MPSAKYCYAEIKRETNYFTEQSEVYFNLISTVFPFISFSANLRQSTFKLVQI